MVHPPNDYRRLTSGIRVLIVSGEKTRSCPAHALTCHNRRRSANFSGKVSWEAKISLGALKEVLKFDSDELSKASRDKSLLISTSQMVRKGFLNDPLPLVPRLRLIEYFPRKKCFAAIFGMGKL